MLALSSVRGSSSILLRRSAPIRRPPLTRQGTSLSLLERTRNNSSSIPRSESILQKIAKRPIEYASIPCVAAFVAIMTNWIAVKMLFYPIEYIGTNLYRAPDTPYGLFGWQGVVPTKTEMMAGRLVKIVTERLLSLQEAFARLEPNELSRLLLPAVQEAVRRDCGDYWYAVLKPVLPLILTRLVRALRYEIDDVVDLHSVVLSAFVRDKVVLVDLFQKVGRIELEFLVNSGFGFGFLLGLAQMGLWAVRPSPWTLPAAGAFVGYVTNWIAIKLLFEPAEKVNVANLFEVQGLFESRQVEVSDEFGAFMEERVLSTPSVLKALASGGDDGPLYAFLRRQLPHPIPSHILSAAVKAIQQVAESPEGYPELHEYVTTKLDIEHTLASRLKLLSPTEFEDLLHPVFQEDETTLIATGGVFGLLAGAAQTRLGWGGPGARGKAVATILGTLAGSAAFYLHQKYEEEHDPPLASVERPELRRRVTVVRPVKYT